MDKNKDYALFNPFQEISLLVQSEQRKFGEMVGGGTCGACDIVDLESVLMVLEPKDDEEETLRWASWGMCDYLLVIDKEPIVTPLQKVMRSLRSAGAIGTTSERMR